MWLTQSAGKRVRVSHNCFWFYFWLDEKIRANVLSQSCSVVDAKPITFRHSNENRSSLWILRLLVAICNQLVSGGGCVSFPCSLVETFVRKQETVTVFNRLFTISNSRLNMPGTEVEEVLCFYAKFFFTYIPT